MTENDLQNEVMAWLRSRGVMCWRNNSTGVFDPTRKVFRRPGKWHRNGVSDIIALCNAKAVFLELKRPPTGKRSQEALWNMLSDAQKSFLVDVRTQGHIGEVVDSLAAVKAIFAPLLEDTISPMSFSPNPVH